MEEDTESGLRESWKHLKEVKAANWGLYKLASEEKVEVQGSRRNGLLNVPKSVSPCPPFSHC